MAKLILEPHGGASFMCPGCGRTHAIRVSGPGAWQWNGSVDAPTLQPSVLFRSGHYAEGWKGPECWCTYNAKHPDADSFTCICCHSFITDGKIEFLRDSTHALAGQTVELPECSR